MTALVGDLAVLSEVGGDGAIQIIRGMFRRVPDKELQNLRKEKIKLLCKSRQVPGSSKNKS